MGATVDSHLHEGARVAEQIDPLARRELAAFVLLRDLLLAAAELRLRTTLVDLLGEVLHAGLLAGFDLVGGLGGLALMPGLICRSHQRPFHSGSRFSKKALTPSWMSSVEKVSESCERRNSSASSSAMSCWRYIASWPRRMSTGLFEASFLAHSSTAESNSAAGTTLLARPYSTACSAEICSPSSIISLTFFRGTLR